MEIFNTSLGASLSGWFAFNMIMLSMYKDENEKTFMLGAYAKEHWDNWAASLVSIPVLLYIGAHQLSLPITDLSNPKWSDLYYLGSGFFVEAVKMAYKKWITKNKV